MPLTFDLEDPKSYRKLVDSLKHNYKALKPFRDVRALTKKAAHGHYYKAGDRPNRYRNPVNMMDTYIQTLVRSFIQNHPRVRVSSIEQRRVARVFQEHLNKTFTEIKLIDSMRTSVKEALLGFIGIAYCGIAPTETDPAGEAFVDAISLDDWVVDMDAKDLSRADYMGHRFISRIDELRDDDSYDQEMVEKLRGDRDDATELQSERERQQQRGDDHRLFDRVTIWHVYIPPTKQVAYIALDQEGVDRPLRIESFDGPDPGPYRYLIFDSVLDELMPNSRAAMMLDLHDFTNRQYFKIMFSESISKEILTYEGGSEDDARRIRGARDGEAIQVNNNDGVQRRKFGGTNPQALGTAIHSRQLFDEQSGGIRVLGGVGPVADTVGQEKLVNQNASRMVRDMQLQVMEFVKEIAQSIAWYEWTHPTRQRKIEIKVGQRGMALEDLWSPQIRDGDFLQHEIDIIPESLEYRTGGEQLQRLMQAVQGMVLPLMQVPTDRPVTLKTPELIRAFADLGQLPELLEVTNYAQDDQFVSQPQGGGSPRVPANAPSGGGGAGGGQSMESALVEQAASMGNANQDESVN